MSKTLVHITAQYSENYGTSENPIWKFKGGQIFRLYADDVHFMYGKEQCVKAIETLLAKQCNPICRYDYHSHELIFSDIIPLDNDLFDKELQKEYHKG